MLNQHSIHGVADIQCSRELPNLYAAALLTIANLQCILSRAIRSCFFPLPQIFPISNERLAIASVSGRGTVRDTAPPLKHTDPPSKRLPMSIPILPLVCLVKECEHVSL